MDIILQAQLGKQQTVIYLINKKKTPIWELMPILLADRGATTKLIKMCYYQGVTCKTEKKLSSWSFTEF